MSEATVGVSNHRSETAACLPTTPWQQEPMMVLSEAASGPWCYVDKYTVWFSSTSGLPFSYEMWLMDGLKTMILNHKWG